MVLTCWISFLVHDDCSQQYQGSSSAGTSRALRVAAYEMAAEKHGRDQPVPACSNELRALRGFPERAPEFPPSGSQSLCPVVIPTPMRFATVWHCVAWLFSTIPD